MCRRDGKTIESVAKMFKVASDNPDDFYILQLKVRNRSLEEVINYCDEIRRCAKESLVNYPSNVLIVPVKDDFIQVSKVCENCEVAKKINEYLERMRSLEKSND